MRYLRRFMATLFLAVVCLGLSAPRHVRAGASRPIDARPQAIDDGGGDHLYLSDYSGGELIWRADATAGATPTDFIDVTSPNGGAPNHAVGILKVNGKLLVANQNIVPTNPPVSGELDWYDSATGAPLGALVPRTSPYAPCGPRGIILGPDQKTLYVANLATPCSTPGPGNSENAKATFVDQKGEVLTFDVTTGQWLGRLKLDSLASQTGGQLHPRGLIFGPDGKLYISLFCEVNFPNCAEGWIVRYDTATDAASIFASQTHTGTGDVCSALLNDPEGMAIAGSRLYTTARGLPGQPDKILVFDLASGNCIDSIDLDPVAGLPSRSYAEALVFGPGGLLYVPMRGTIGYADVGQVRAYNVTTKAYTDFTNRPASPTARFFFPLFGKTNPTTLVYGP